jgi:LacI family transcriptional regulator
LDKQPTIRDVAAAAGVSVSVVSRVLNDSGPVAPEKRRAVVQTIENLAYRPRAAAKELSQGSALTIGLVLADLTNPFFARLADRIVWEARARGARVVLMTTQEDPYIEAESLDALLDRSVAGVIATPTGENVDKWLKLDRIGVKVVFVDRAIPDLEQFDLVSIANEKSAATATDSLIALGHTRIGMISGPLSTSTGRARVDGYRQSLRRAGIPVDPTLIRPAPFRGEGGADAVVALLAQPEPPTALIVGNTAQVQNTVRRLLQLSTNVPDDLSLIVFDDNPWIDLVTPPLSAVRQPIDLLARHSVELILARIQGRIPVAQRTIEVEAEFVERSSCAPVALAAQTA